MNFFSYYINVMKIGVIVALEKEINSLLNHFNVKLNTQDKFDVKEVKYKNHEIFILKSNVGEIASAISTQYLIDKYNVELIINYGVVGLLNESIDPYKLLIVNKVSHYDFDTSLIDHVPVGQYEEFESIYLPVNFFKVDELINKLNLVPVTCASGDKFISDIKMKNYLMNNFKADICEMELAGIALTCIRNNIKLISIKGTSDFACSNEYNDEKVTSVSEIITQVILKIIDLI